MQRVRLDLAYDGAGFHGWAAQDGLRTVEGELAAALAVIVRRPVRLTVAGRTDAGVHASAQVAHVDLDAAAWDATALEGLKRRLNSLLAASYAKRWRPLAERGLVPAAMADKGISDLVVHRLTPVTLDFDARFSALARHYRYLAADASQGRNPIARADQWWCPYHLDWRAMDRAAARLVGLHDFLSFCKPRDGATTIRTLKTLAVSAHDGLVRFDVSADAFCHSMVRSLVGCLVEVGRGRKDEAWVASVLSDPSRSHQIPVAPARGLTLVGVDYPDEESWAHRAEQARSRRSSSELDA